MVVNRYQRQLSSLGETHNKELQHQRNIFATTIAGLRGKQKTQQHVLEGVTQKLEAAESRVAQSGDERVQKLLRDERGMERAQFNLERRQTEWAGTQANIRREQTELRKEKFSGVHARTTKQLAKTQAVTEKYKLRVADLDEKVTDLEEKLHAASESDMVVIFF